MEENKILTIEDFLRLPKRTVFAEGQIIDSPEGCNMMNSGKMLEWKAKTGEVGDWAIYCGYVDKSNAPANIFCMFGETYDVLAHGEKVSSSENVRACVPCDDEVLARYRK